MSQRSTTIKSQAGFTLVELAIVMIIIGLLIGGVLKGQELIGNAQVTATVAQVKAIEAATSTFKDTYAGLPGDLPNPQQRLPNCIALPCNTPTAATWGDNTLNSTPDAAPGTEAQAYFVQLSTANLMTGVAPGLGAVFGGYYPQAKISGNGFRIGSATNASPPGGLTGNIGVLGASGGLYLALVNAPAGAVGTGTVNLKPTEASRIDTKIDDGVPSSGSVLGIGQATCGGVVAGSTTASYATNNSGNTCGLYIHIQG